MITSTIVRSKKMIVLVDTGNPINNASMTHGHGEMTLTYAQLVEKLGNPTSKGDGYKNSAEWEIITPHGIGTIYDWKECKTYCGRKEGINKRFITSWHIGAHNQETADDIRNIFFK